ncbi:hypothetical protein EDB80DRAFT_693482 [Ilyonectria destructans]|nr:hypothetical protein EDB80DRAFT_693482 [Ilyonectria destructans]
MDSNDDFNPYSESKADTNAFSEEASFLAPSEEDSIIQSSLDFEIGSLSSQAIITEDINSKIYIFKYSLFKKSILPLKEGKEEEMEIKCTMCNYKKIEKVRGFQSSNFQKHYKAKHPEIA